MKSKLIERDQDRQDTFPSRLLIAGLRGEYLRHEIRRTEPVPVETDALLLKCGHVEAGLGNS